MSASTIRPDDPDRKSQRDPHARFRLLTAGEPLGQARAAVVLLHGRGAGADDILQLAEAFPQPGFAYLAPEAAGHTWYPNRFLAPLESNEPWLTSALNVVGTTLGQLGEHGVPPERVVLLGFSQGACLALEYAARNARRYGGVVGLSGGLIGPPDRPRDDTGSLDATPVTLGCGDADQHVPIGIVEQSAAVLGRLGGQVTLRVYPGMGHQVVEDEIELIRALLALF